MEDSIEDFIRISKNTKEGSKEPKLKFSKELLVTAQRKKECEAHAVKIVEFLIEGKLRPEVFLRCLKYINQDYYQDIVEERAITKLCGYSLCGKRIPDMPRQKYVILSKSNKIFEITDRKNYCSNFCYKASVHVKQQIETSPLWLRNFNEPPNFTLLPSSEIGLPGVEVDQGLIKPEVELQSFTSVTQYTKFSLDEVSDIEKVSKKCKNSKVKFKNSSNIASTMNTINEDDDEETYDEEAIKQFEAPICDLYDLDVKDNCKSNKKIDDLNKVKSKDKMTNEADKLNYLINKLKINKEPKTKLIEAAPLQKPNRINLIEIKDKNKSHKAIKTQIKSNQDTKKEKKEILNTLKKCIKEWLTLDTYMYIYGEAKIKQTLDEKKLSEYFDKLKVTELQTSLQLKYMNICKKLQLQELAEDKFDCALTGKTLKPLPDYKKLKQENRDLNLKVKSFFDGIMYEQLDTNFPTKPVKENVEAGQPTVLPLVDTSAQNALRRKVFLTSIDRTLRRLIDELKLTGSRVLSDVHDLVKTFKLEAHNVIFKPTTWNLIAVILINMLGLKDDNIKNRLLNERSIEHVDLILSQFDGIDDFMKELLCTIEDLDGFVEYYITHV